MEIRKQLGHNIRKYRKQTGLSQEQFALKYDIDRAYVSGIERGKRNPTIVIVAKFAAALEISVADLFEGVEAG